MGRVFCKPDQETHDRMISLKQEMITVSRKLNYLRDLPAETPDGHRVRMQANIELPVEVEEALSRGAEGVGLLRTEYLYFQHRDIPSEEDQVRIYTNVLERVSGRPVIFRSLDVGGDKVSDSLLAVQPRPLQDPDPRDLQGRRRGRRAADVPHDHGCRGIARGSGDMRRGPR